MNIKTAKFWQHDQKIGFYFFPMYVLLRNCRVHIPDPWRVERPGTRENWHGCRVYTHEPTHQNKGTGGTRNPTNHGFFSRVQSPSKEKRKVCLEWVALIGSYSILFPPQLTDDKIIPLSASLVSSTAPLFLGTRIRSRILYHVQLRYFHGVFDHDIVTGVSYASGSVCLSREYYSVIKRTNRRVHYYFLRIANGNLVEWAGYSGI